MTYQNARVYTLITPHVGGRPIGPMALVLKGIIAAFQILSTL